MGSVTVAVVVPAEGANPDPDLRESDSARIPSTPDRVVFREELPSHPDRQGAARELVAEFTRSTA